jgi:glycosyltransferase involved in cell wall biosynthesis
MKKISIVTPCFNEEENLENFYLKIKEVFQNIHGYTYEQIFIDNCSTDNTRMILEKIAAVDKNIKVIFNTRNFGHLRSWSYALLQAYGDAVILIACDFQDPPDLIPQFIEKWEEGYKIVLGQKTRSEEGRLMYAVRSLYYKIMKTISEFGHLDHVTGFGLYDQMVIEKFRELDDPHPYYRGIICDLGYEVELIEYTQPRRKGGKSSYNFFKYFDAAIEGITSTSKAPMRIASLGGLLLTGISISVLLLLIVLKIIYGDSINVGMVMIAAGLFLFGSVQLTFIGMIGEYIYNIQTKIDKRPLVVEQRRINFADADGENGR